MKISYFKLIVLVFAFISQSAKAQLGFAVATDLNGSQINYGLVFGYNTSAKAKSQAIIELRTRGYDRVFGATGVEFGHFLKTGFYVLLKSTFTLDGHVITCYGLGASDKNFDEAEFRAQRNMYTYSKWDEEKYSVIIKKQY